MTEKRTFNTLFGHLDELEKLEHICKNPIYADEIIHLRSRMQSNFFKVAVVGEFGSDL
jgi:hypothetical protein